MLKEGALNRDRGAKPRGPWDSLGRKRRGVGIQSAGAGGGVKTDGQVEDFFSTTSNSLSSLLLSHNSLNL